MFRSVVSPEWGTGVAMRIARLEVNGKSREGTKDLRGWVSW